MDFPAAVQGYLAAKKILLCHTKQRYTTTIKKCDMDQIMADLIQSSGTFSTYGETKNKHT